MHSQVFDDFAFLLTLLYYLKKKTLQKKKKKKNQYILLLTINEMAKLTKSREYTKNSCDDINNDRTK